MTQERQRGLAAIALLDEDAPSERAAFFLFAVLLPRHSPAGLKWKNIDFATGLLRGEVALPERLLELLEDLPFSPNEHVFFPSETARYKITKFATEVRNDFDYHLRGGEKGDDGFRTPAHMNRRYVQQLQKSEETKAGRARNKRITDNQKRKSDASHHSGVALSA
jgi:hypothetical protein